MVVFNEVAPVILEDLEKMVHFIRMPARIAGSLQHFHLRGAILDEAVTYCKDVYIPGTYQTKPNHNRKNENKQTTKKQTRKKERKKKKPQKTTTTTQQLNNNTSDQTNNIQTKPKTTTTKTNSTPSLTHLQRKKERKKNIESIVIFRGPACCLT